METRHILLAAGMGGAVALYLYSRTQEGEDAISSTTDEISSTLSDTVEKVVSTVRGIRNNNPGNIRKSAEKWQGLSTDQSDPAFFRFVSMAYGIRAMVVILRNYAARYGLDTPQGIINRWAPPNENDTGAYSRAVADSMGVSTTAHLDVHDPEVMFGLVRAIIAHENGKVAALLVSDGTVREGIALA